MPERKIDPETGEPALTYRENRFVDGYIAAGGNATRAAIPTGYNPNRADRAGSKVLARPKVQERIQAPIAEDQVDPKNSAFISFLGNSSPGSGRFKETRSPKTSTFLYSTLFYASQIYFMQLKSVLCIRTSVG